MLVEKQDITEKQTSQLSIIGVCFQPRESNGTLIFMEWQEMGNFGNGTRVQCNFSLNELHFYIRTTYFKEYWDEGQRN